jgi:hypothetical protein
MLSLPSPSHSVSSSDSSSPWVSNSPLKRSDLKATAKASGGVTSTVAKQPIKDMLNKHNPKGGNPNIERVISGPFAGAVKKSHIIAPSQHQGQEALSLFDRPNHNPGFDKDGEMFAPGADVIGDLMARQKSEQNHTPSGGKRKSSKSKRKTSKSKRKTKTTKRKSKRKHFKK